MTISELILKLETEGRIGANILSDNYKRLKKLCEAIDAEKTAAGQLVLKTHRDSVYHEIHGFLCGLCTVGYISETELDILTNEALEVGFGRVEDDE